VKEFVKFYFVVKPNMFGIVLGRENSCICFKLGYYTDRSFPSFLSFELGYYTSRSYTT
jgi:hypothetical protein